MDDSSVARLQTLIKSLTLRRHKQTEINGKPIIELPGITHYRQNVKLNAGERELYQRIEDRAHSFFKQESVWVLFVNLFRRLVMYGYWR